jgi:hypothetical protein
MYAFCDLVSTYCRRCGNSLEQAVGFLFEHAADMPQIVEAEQQAEAARAARIAAAAATAAAAAGGSTAASSGTSNSSGGAASSVRAALAQQQRQQQQQRAAPSDSSGFIRQLLDMGFPPVWAQKALDVSTS